MVEVPRGRIVQDDVLRTTPTLKMLFTTAWPIALKVAVLLFLKSA